MGVEHLLVSLPSRDRENEMTEHFLAHKTLLEFTHGPTAIQATNERSLFCSEFHYWTASIFKLQIAAFEK